MVMITTYCSKEDNKDVVMITTEERKEDINNSETTEKVKIFCEKFFGFIGNFLRRNFF